MLGVESLVFSVWCLVFRVSGAVIGVWGSNVEAEADASELVLDVIAVPHHHLRAGPVFQAHILLCHSTRGSCAAGERNRDNLERFTDFHLKVAEAKATIGP